MVQCCPSCCYREDGTRKRKLKTWAIVLLSMLALGLGLGLAVKLYYFTPTRVIASVNLLGHNSDTFTAAEQVKFRTGISTLLSVELGKVAVSGFRISRRRDVVGGFCGSSCRPRRPRRARASRLGLRLR